MALTPIEHTTRERGTSDEEPFSVLHRPGSRSSSANEDEEAWDADTVAIDDESRSSISETSYVDTLESDSESEVEGRPTYFTQLHAGVRLVQTCVISKVKECRWLGQFMNRSSPKEPLHAVEVLNTFRKPAKAIIDESDQHQHSKYGGPGSFLPHKVDDDDDTCIQRIRIQSKDLLDVFSRVTGFELGTKTLTFVRPFQYLVHHHEEFKAELKRLVASISEIESVSDIEVLLEQMALNPRIVAAESYRNHPPKAVAELQDLLCYVDFIETKLMPEIARFREKTYSGRLKVWFDDLWYLFEPGELVYVPVNSLLKATETQVARHGIPIGDSSHETSMHQSIWRLAHTYVPPAEVHPTSASRQDGKSFDSLCYYLDYDGAVYGASGFRFKMPYFDGERDVRELGIYPLKYALAADELLREAKKIGRMYTEAVTKWHVMYDGWTFVTNPIGIPILDSNYVRERRQKRPEHIEGDVIVDFKEAFNSCPAHKSNFLDGIKVTQRRSFSGILENPHRIVVWTDNKRSRIVSSTPEMLVTDDNCQAAEHNAALDMVPYLRESTRPATILNDDDLALLPRRIFAYSLRQRKFAPIDVQHLRLPQVREHPIADLQLPDDHKKTIQAAVHAHLRRKGIERCIKSKANGEILAQDLIANKDRGLLIMLHGEPGVGKTATAEAVAQSTRRPLFPISGSDLLGPSWVVEDRLSEILRLSHLWDCVLLLDEADVVLSARSLRENTSHLVSMFLRSLEYYNGIMILTTSRIGRLDPALTSRIHLILHYKRLGVDEIENIFRVNIARLQNAESQQSAITNDPPLVVDTSGVLRFAADHYNKFPKGKGSWNGRQIRNAFVVAAALARAESESFKAMGLSPRLRYDHFAEVEKLTLGFDQFRAKVLGGDDSFRAKSFKERDDDCEMDGKKKCDKELMHTLYAAQKALAAVTNDGKLKK